MDLFHYRDGELFCEDVPVKNIVEKFGTPVFIYSKNTLKRHFLAFENAFSWIDHITCFSVKSLSNIAILNLISKWGGGFDIVSKGELFRVITSGGDPKKTVFSGVGKTYEEILYAAQQGILMINVESLEELEKIEEVGASLKKKIPISIRINPEVDPNTHPYIATGIRESKFGINPEDAEHAYRRALKLQHVEPVGVDVHIGSQITEIGPFSEAIDKIVEFTKLLEDIGVEVRFLDIGGGLGIKYKDEEPPHPEDLGKTAKEKLSKFSGTLIVEPGRSISGNAGIFVSKVIYRKKKGKKTFLVVDGGMNELIRPSLYGAHHEVIPVIRRDGEIEKADIVGPICETGDFIAKEREIERLTEGDLIAVRGAGAYCSTMSSNYNSRPRSPEVMVDGERFFLIREREKLKDLILKELIPGDLSP